MGLPLFCGSPALLVQQFTRRATRACSRTQANRVAAGAIGAPVRAGQVVRCLVVSHVWVAEFAFGAGGEQRFEQGGKHGAQFSTVSLSLHQECGRTTKQW